MDTGPVYEKCTKLVRAVDFFRQAVPDIITLRILESFGSLFFMVSGQNLVAVSAVPMLGQSKQNNLFKEEVL